MASYTGHGHYIPGMPEKTAPMQRARCGGPGICLPCSTDVMRAYDGAQMLFSNPAGVTPKKESSLMSEPTNTFPAPVSDNVFNKAVRALHSLGHDMKTAEDAVVQLLHSGIVLRDVNEADKVVNEAAPILEAAEPTLAPEVESVQHVATEVAADTAKASADAQEFIDEVNPPA